MEVEWCVQCSCSHQQPLDDGVSVLALVVHHLNVVQVGVSPVHEPADEVQRDAVGEHNLAVHELSSVLAIHVTALHLGDLTVVCEEHLPVETKGSGLIEDGWMDRLDWKIVSAGKERKVGDIIEGREQAGLSLSRNHAECLLNIFSYWLS